MAPTRIVLARLRHAGLRGGWRPKGLALGAAAVAAVVLAVAPRRTPEHAHPGGDDAVRPPGPTSPAPALPDYAADTDFTAFPTLAAAGPATAVSDGPPDFNRHVRPILAEFCFDCHGPDAAGRKADLRLDRREDALGDAASGRPVVRPGDPDGSDLVARVGSPDRGRMPPRSYGKQPSAAQAEVLRRWVAAGAPYAGHWAFTPPRAAAPPAVGRGWVRNPIDAFVLARLERAGLSPAPEADPPALLRRVSLALTGLPPTSAELDAFLRDSALRTPHSALEAAVNRLLASPHYGERMAAPWLDLARYADTNGGTTDDGREMWRYRDWVVAAFNANLPFDRFTAEQLAGDLLPDATVEQRIATGFLRNESFRVEVCSEQRVAYRLVDRANTVASTWLGLTAGCAQCHDHKYDPLTQRDYYRLLAFFNTDPRPARPDQPVGFVMDPRGNVHPVVTLPPSLFHVARLETARAWLAAVQGEIAEKVRATTLPTAAPHAQVETAWVTDRLPPGATSPTGAAGWDYAPAPGGATAVRVAAREGEVWREFAGAALPLTVARGDILVVNVYLDPAAPPAELLVEFRADTAEHRAFWGENRIARGLDGSAGRRRLGPFPPVGAWVRLEVPVEAVGLPAGNGVTGLAVGVVGGAAFVGPVGVVRSARAESLAAWEAFERDRDDGDLPPPVLQALRTPPDRRTAAEAAAVRSHYVEHVYAPTRPAFAALHKVRDAALWSIQAAAAEIPSVMVMEEPRQRADTFVLTRGRFDQRGETATPGVPGFLPPLPAGAKADRLAFAHWLTRPDHPLTARVMVNRVWQMHFGTGLVATPEDFGAQGEPPSHPELLDWLAVRFVESGWDVKALHKLIVTSATYRQSSRVSPELLRVDPANRLLARGPRFRLPAEVVRDTALSVSGLLNPALGGPGVRPYQPAGLWDAVKHPSPGLSAQEYEPSRGPELYRRGVYLYWKRTMPHPSLALFDAPERDVCVARRPQTNTALQALARLNDPIVVECARGAAARMLREAGPEADERLAYGFRLCTARAPRPHELAVLRRLYDAEVARFRADPTAAAALLAVGEAANPPGADPAELAALTVAAHLLLNLDETITLE